MKAFFLVPIIYILFVTYDKKIMPLPNFDVLETFAIAFYHIMTSRLGVKLRHAIKSINH